MMERPAPWQILFSVKIFVAAMLALYIAFALDLNRPYWALATAYIVSQPFSGAIRSKGVFRIAGTFVGAAVGVALAGIFGNDQVLMMAGLVAWMFFCGWFALNIRDPRFYFFLLAGMTTLLVAWPGSSLSAGPAFDTAMARFLEIGLGILCTVVVDSIFFPRRVEPVIDGMIDTWFRDAGEWTRDVLDGKREAAVSDRARLAADAAQINALTVHLDYEHHDGPRRARWTRVLQSRMLLVLPVLSSIDDRLSELRRVEGGVPDTMQGILDRLRTMLGGNATPEAIADLNRQVEAFDARSAARTDWGAITLVSLCRRLSELLRLWDDCLALRAQTREPQRKASARLRRLAKGTVTAPHRDPVLIVWALASSLLSFLVCAAFWYFTGWDQGGTAAMFALMMSLFFGAIDNPLPMIKLMMKVVVFAIILDALYLYVILPSTHSFPTLVIAFAPALLVLGILASNPATFVVALMPVALMSLQSTPSTALIPYVNGMLGAFFGITVVLLLSGVAKSVSAEVAAGRILKAGWRDLARIAGTSGGADKAAFTSRMLDRLGLLAPRLAAVDATHGLPAVDALSDLRLGLNLIELQRRRQELPQPLAAEVGAALEAIAVHFGHLSRGRKCAAPGHLLQCLDRALAEAIRIPEQACRRSVVLALAGARRSLFTQAPAPATRTEEPPFTPLARMAAE